jgi:hypothetical protein
VNDSYKDMLQAAARRFYSLKTEYERARVERDEATARFDQLGASVRDVEEQLCQSVGSNIQKRLFQVDAGRFVLVRFVNATFSCAEVLELEEQL